jgi:hypothetical protein
VREPNPFRGAPFRAFRGGASSFVERGERIV